jgi:nicotinate-nucleotide adenylyltransferase
MRVALFGGSFNPPHVAHQLVALYVLETAEVDQLWLVPCFKHPFEKVLAPFEDRLEMCRRAAAALGPRARVSDVEARLGGESRTLRTVHALLAESPGTEFSLIVGADLVRELPSWYRAEELQRLVRIIVVGRTGFEGGEAGPAMPAISSSEVRERLAQGRPVDALLPRSVLDYVRQRKLYGLVESQSQ